MSGPDWACRTAVKLAAPYTGLASGVLCLKYVFVGTPGAHSHNLAKLALAPAKLGTFDELLANYFSFHDE